MVTIPHGHWKTTTLIAGMRSSDVVAPFVIDSPVNRLIFEAWVEQALVPEMRPGDIVVMDNLSSHKGPAVRALIEAQSAHLLYLPPYSPDFNPIENLFAKLKALLRREAARTIDTLWNALGRILDRVTPRECQRMFAAAGYDPDGWDQALAGRKHRQSGGPRRHTEPSGPSDMPEHRVWGSVRLHVWTPSASCTRYCP